LLLILGRTGKPELEAVSWEREKGDRPEVGCGAIMQDSTRASPGNSNYLSNNGMEGTRRRRKRREAIAHPRG